MTRYYVSRAVISAAFGGLLAVTGSPWWMAALIGAGVFALFLYAPRSGRYAVHPEFGVTALRRDERAQAINDKAARNALVVMGLWVAGIAIYFGNVALANVPVIFLNLALVLAALAYFLSDFWLRRS